MQNIFIASDNIFSPLGSTTLENFESLKENKSSLQIHNDTNISALPFCASLFKKDIFFAKDRDNNYTKFERLLIASITDALKNSSVNASDKKTILIISTTKGNISLLETEENNLALQKRIALHTSAKRIATFFNCSNQPIVVSNACISGILAILTAIRLIQNGMYENAIVAGADIISKFVLSGFQSFQAVSNDPCKPFDEARNGINLGEGAATVILTSEKKYSMGIKILSGGTGNDANHISGPSRTGEELSYVITKALHDANVSTTAIDFISAHGTATLYNDEMEAKAIALSELEANPVNSLKGFYGHTLGAAGLIESVVSIQSLKENIILPSKGFEKIGVSKPINICSELIERPIKTSLKTASGFGGCNAALLFSKE